MGSIYIRETSCFNDCCRYAPTCPDWTKTKVKCNQNVPLVDLAEAESDVVSTATLESDDDSSLDIPLVALARSLNANAANEIPTDEQVSVSNVVHETTSDKASVGSTSIATDVTGDIFCVGCMVRAAYRRKLYVGKVLKYNKLHNDYYINFMQKLKRSEKYVWPVDADKVWIEACNVKNEVTVDENGYVQDKNI